MGDHAMHELASEIRNNLVPLTEEYTRCLKEVDGYAEMPAQDRLEAAWGALQLVSAGLQAGDRQVFTEYLHSLADEWVAQGIEVESVERALTLLIEVLEPRFNSVETASLLWRTVLEVQRTSVGSQALSELAAEQGGTAEERVQRREQELRLILDQMPAMVWYKDTENNILHLNRAAAATMGLPVSEVEGKSVYELNPVEAELYHQDDLEVINSGEPKVGIVEPLVTASGERRWLQTDKIPYRDEEGNIIGVIVFALDITEHKRAEETLKQSQQMLQLIMNNIPQSIFWKDRDLVFLGCNLNFAEDAGLDSPDLIVGRDDFDMPWLEQAELYQADDRQVIESGAAKLNYEEPQDTPDGGQIWLRTSKVPLRDAEGEVMAVLGMYEDITERKRLEQAVQESLERRGRQIQTSTEVAQEIAGAPALAELYKRVVRLVKERFGYYHTQIFGHDPDQDVMVVVEGYGQAGERMKAAGHRLPYGQGVVGTAAANGEPVLASDVTQDPNWVPHPELPDTRGELAVPIKLADRVLGVLDVQSDVAGALSEEDQMLLEGLCGQIAVAMESTRLRQETEDNLRELERLYGVMSREGWDSFRKQTGSRGYRFERGQVVATESRTESQAIVTPLSVRGEVLGVLGVQGDVEDPLSVDDVALVESVAEQVAQALESARLFEQTQAALMETEALYTGSDQVVRAATVDEVLRALAESTALQRFDRASIAYFNRPWEEEAPGMGNGAPGMGSGAPEEAVILAAWERSGQEPLAPSGTRYPLAQFPAIDEVTRGNATIFGDVTTDERVGESMRALLVDRLGMRSLGLWPLVAGGQWVGLLTGQASTALDLSESEVRQIATLVDQAATVIQTQRLFEQTQMALAETEGLYRASADLNAAQTYDEVLSALRNHTILGEADHSVSISLFDRPWIGREAPEWVFATARWSPVPSEVNIRYRLQDFPSAAHLLRPDAPTVVVDIEADPRLDERVRALYAERYGVRSTIAAPLVVGGRWLGYVDGLYIESTEFSEDQIRLLMVLAAQAAVVVQNLHQLDETEARAERERLVRSITDRVRRGTARDAIMRTALQELGQMLGASMSIVRLGTQEQLLAGDDSPRPEETELVSRERS